MCFDTVERIGKKIGKKIQKNVQPEGQEREEQEKETDKKKLTCRKMMEEKKVWKQSVCRKKFIHRHVR